VVPEMLREVVVQGIRKVAGGGPRFQKRWGRRSAGAIKGGG
jgi:hypothetical protein